MAILRGPFVVFPSCERETELEGAIEGASPFLRDSPLEPSKGRKKPLPIRISKPLELEGAKGLSLRKTLAPSNSETGLWQAPKPSLGAFIRADYTDFLLG